MVEGVDKAFLLILGVSFIFLIGLTITMLVFIYKYNKEKNPRATQIKGSNTLEIIWTVIPTILVLVMFYYGWAGWKPMTKPPKDSFNITVNSRMWNFTFEYENGKKTDTLFIPKDKAVKLNLRSMDVIHSVYIPAFRVKQDVVPGAEKFLWFIPQKEGIYELFCTEYCGLNHSYMYNWVKVMPEEDFNKWYVDTTQKAMAVVDSPTAAGKRIMTNIGCFACHSIDGSKLVGPSFKGIYGGQRTVKTGSDERQVVADDEYIHRSIFDPNADIVDGFNKGLMLPYTTQLTEDDVKLIIEYMKTL
ncbi:MAG: cytochrome c oxidase subunit II [Bacteroidetes bacterium GWF2_42_66]|nr:MAG: cytochrome c oxidase subunit II [Bacteroidetes bacterium GWA2_42_15]OFX97070.1 MAG: cytochrome c oxidase subunit II [Bacteroidetes bacterium GWE2_42_39]OFY46160.1 MAG: cytochrome c oxidase subunit II [Bacteroidetes bacterium GWF2_42_66]